MKRWHDDDDHTVKRYEIICIVETIQSKLTSSVEHQSGKWQNLHFCMSCSFKRMLNALNDNKKNKKICKCLKMKNRCTAFTRQNISKSIDNHRLIKEKIRKFCNLLYLHHHSLQIKCVRVNNRTLCLKCCWSSLMTSTWWCHKTRLSLPSFISRAISFGWCVGNALVLNKLLNVKTEF